MQNANRFFWDSNWREVKTETVMAEKSSWDQENRRQNLSLVWRNRKKISQIIKDYFYLPFFLLIILWLKDKHHCMLLYAMFVYLFHWF